MHLMPSLFLTQCYIDCRFVPHAILTVILCIECRLCFSHNVILTVAFVPHTIRTVISCIECRLCFSRNVILTIAFVPRATLLYYALNVVFVSHAMLY